MSINTEVEEWIRKIEQLHPEDPVICEYWDRMTEILSRDEQETISYIEELTDSNIVNNLSSVFEDVSSNLQSKRFISCIESLENKFPDLLLKHMIYAAKEAVIEDQMGSDH